ncbi:hypothetical protein [Chryseobacterium sp. 52]|uniref:hypothetical protein n=1 Tax=Chryseobacterium sp. 52 TaxID=2035213 RepID=UPI00117D4DD1|nr:hypothetical protein [Chryseobacterium sp. 52]
MMTEEQLKEHLAELADIMAEVAHGRYSIAMLDRINHSIYELNTGIDMIYNENRLEREYDMIDLCYQFYRLRDKIIELHL